MVQEVVGSSPIIHPNKHLWCNGSIPVSKTVGLSSNLSRCANGDIAQLVEQWTENPCVTGSIPVITTKNV